MSQQIAVRLPEELVAFIDEVVASGAASSRAGFVTVALRREERRRIAERDAAILATINDDAEGFDELATQNAEIPMDLD